MKKENYLLSKHTRKLIEKKLNFRYNELMNLEFEEIIDIVNKKIAKEETEIYIMAILMDKDREITKDGINKILRKKI